VGEVRASSTNYISTASTLALSAGQWYHVEMSVNRSTHTIDLFVGGVETSYSATAAINSGHVVQDNASLIKIGADTVSSSAATLFTGYIDIFRMSSGVIRNASNYTPPVAPYGGSLSQTIPTITLTGAATQLAADEDIEFTAVTNQTKPANNQKLTDSGIGLVLTNLTGGDKNKATLTGTIASAASTTHTNMAIKAQVRKSLGDAAYNNSTLVTFSGSTTTVGLAPGMPLTGTGISVAGPLVCGLTNTDATVTAASTTGLVVGMQVNAFTGVPAGATILSIITNTSFELSANATATDADAKLTFNTIISAVASATTLTLSNVTTL